METDETNLEFVEEKEEYSPETAPSSGRKESNREKTEREYDAL